MTGENIPAKVNVKELTAPGSLSNLDLRSTVRVLTPVVTAFLLSGCTEQQDEYLRKEGYTYYHALPLIKNSQVDSKNPLDNAKTISAIYAERDGDPFLIYERKANGSTERESYPIHLLYVGTPDAIETVVIIAPNDPKTEDETWKSDPNKFQELLTLELRKPVSKETLDNWQTDPDSVDIKTMTFWDPLNGKGITVGEESDEGPKEVAMLLVSPSVARPNGQVTVTPTLVKLEIQTPAPIEILLPPAVTMEDLGITDPSSDLAKAFSGAEKSVSLEADGSFSVNAIGYQGETKVENKYIIVPGSFNTNLDIENDFRPATIDAYVLDADGKKTDQTIKLIWDKDRDQWRIPFVVEKVPFMPEGDQRVIIESALLYFRDHSPFGEGAIASYIKNGGNSLFFELNSAGKSVILKSKGNDNTSLTEDQATMKFTDIGVYYYIDGVPYIVPLIVNLDPIDQKIPKTDEFKVFFGTSGREATNMTEEERMEYVQKIDHSKGFLYPTPVLYGDEDYQKKFPLLVKLLGLPGNNLKLKSFLPDYANIVGNLGYLDQLSSTNTPLETQAFTKPLPPEIQTMIFFFNFAGPGT